ncbi:MAG: hypothetical protein ABSB01_22390 [Streptosporangiaceae bacterium]|jgi:hypothetical protein
MSADETVLGGGRFGTDEAGFAAMADYVNWLRPAVEDRAWTTSSSRCFGCWSTAVGP